MHVLVLITWCNKIPRKDAVQVSKAEVVPLTSSLSLTAVCELKYCPSGSRTLVARVYVPSTRIVWQTAEGDALQDRAMSSYRWAQARVSVSVLASLIPEVLWCRETQQARDWAYNHEKRQLKKETTTFIVKATKKQRNCDRERTPRDASISELHLNAQRDFLPFERKQV